MHRKRKIIVFHTKSPMPYATDTCSRTSLQIVVFFIKSVTKSGRVFHATIHLFVQVGHSHVFDLHSILMETDKAFSDKYYNAGLPQDVNNDKCAEHSPPEKAKRNHSRCARLLTSVKRDQICGWQCSPDRSAWSSLAPSSVLRSLFPDKTRHNDYTRPLGQDIWAPCHRWKSGEGGGGGGGGHPHRGVTWACAVKHCQGCQVKVDQADME